MDIHFKWIGGATFILSIGNLKIAIDPVLCPRGTVQDYFWFKSKRLEDPIYSKTDFEAIDLWLITHNHEDHLDKEGLTQINAKAKVVSNPNAVKKLQNAGIEINTVLQHGNQVSFKIKGYQLSIEAIPAIHGINPLSAFFAGRVNGYFVEIKKDQEQKSLYITSDTVYKKTIIRAIRNRKIDLLIANMGAAKQGSWIMTLTLSAKMLQKMIAALNPTLVIPVHYGTFEHYKEPVEEIRALKNKRITFLEVGEMKSWSI